MMWDRQRLVLIILFVSLAINLFLAGLVVARRTELSTTPATHLMAGSGVLNTELVHRPEVVAAWKRRESSVHVSRHELHAAQQRVKEILDADQWDADALSSALAELRQQVGVAQEAWHQILLEAAAVLPADQRMQLTVLAPGMGRAGGGKCR
jgi:uncharacterized membrane protein